MLACEEEPAGNAEFVGERAACWVQGIRPSFAEGESDGVQPRKLIQRGQDAVACIHAGACEAPRDLSVSRARKGQVRDCAVPARETGKCEAVPRPERSACEEEISGGHADSGHVGPPDNSDGGS